MSNDIQRFPSSLPFPFSRAVKAGGFLFLSGQVPHEVLPATRERLSLTGWFRRRGNDPF